MKKQTSIIVAVLAGILLIALAYNRGYLSTPNSSPPATSETTSSISPLRVGIVTWAGFATGYVAKEKGYFGDLPVEFSVIDDAAARRSAFAAGHLDILAASVDEFAQKSPQGLGGKIVLATDESYGGDGLVVKRDVTSFTDLKGKKIAYAEGTPSHFLLLRLLSKNGMTTKDVVPALFDDTSKAGEAYLGGSVDAAVTWEPFLSQIVTNGDGKILVSSRDEPGLIVDILLAGDDVLQQRDDDVRTFISGWMRAVDYIASDPQGSYAIMAKELGIPLADVDGMAQGLRFADQKRNGELFSTGASNTTSPIEQLFDTASKLWLDEGLIDTATQANKAIESKFVVNP